MVKGGVCVDDKFNGLVTRMTKGAVCTMLEVMGICGNMGIEVVSYIDGILAGAL